MGLHIKFLHNHVLGKKGSVLNVPIPKANYLIRCGVAKECVEKSKTETKLKQKTKKDGIKSANSKAKPEH